MYLLGRSTGISPKRSWRLARCSLPCKRPLRHLTSLNLSETAQQGSFALHYHYWQHKSHGWIGEAGRKEDGMMANNSGQERKNRANSIRLLRVLCNDSWTTGSGMYVQGWTKTWSPGSVNMRWKSCVLLPAEGRRTQLFHLIFTEPGVYL